MWPAALLALPLCAALAATSSACGLGGSACAAVDPAAGKKPLGEVPDTGQGGGKPGDLIERTPRVLVTDLGWQAGSQPLSHGMGGGEKIDDLTAAATVELSVRGKSDRVGKNRASYHVTTSPPSAFRRNG
ncbi:hypothetical protein [Aquisphaera insulae]|uniref:hypothetical protein n=1 Tax=Aquisphaera insulae TaxID=2712864 RepID=UPI0013EB461D|nr:hypothetical protein [Aquisphaera insulae]